MLEQRGGNASMKRGESFLKNNSILAGYELPSNLSKTKDANHTSSLLKDLESNDASFSRGIPNSMEPHDFPSMVGGNRTPHRRLASLPGNPPLAKNFISEID